MKEELEWYWINNIDGVGRKTLARLFKTFASPKDIYHADEVQIMRALSGSGLEQKTANVVSSRDMHRFSRQYEELKKKGIHFIYPVHEQFPRRLLNIPDVPFGLYYKGHMPDMSCKAVAIIGARNCTNYGKELARYFGRELAKCGISIISGLARGVDKMAHVGALEAGGYTMGILGCGIDRIYPEEHYHLFMELVKCGGILSESGPGIRPMPGLFPQRNRLIAGMADGILVIEAMEKSGTFITVDQGLEQGKDIFALPGRVTDVSSAGCNNLIKLGAHLVTDVSDILEVLHIDKKETVQNGQITEKKETQKSDGQKISLAPHEKMLYSVLSIEPRYLDDIIREVQLAPQEVCMILNRLAVKGIIEETARNYYAVRL